MPYEYRQLTREKRAELLKQRLAAGHPPHSPPHPDSDQALYLLTAACYHHQNHMTKPERRSALLEARLELHSTANSELVAWVILPNHYHLLARVADPASLGHMFQTVHGRLSRQWNLEDDTPRRKVWYCYSDRAIRSERHYYTTLNYIHYNPVKHGWCESPYDWTHSSVMLFLERYGREWLQDLWVRYPVRQYGRGWDDFPGR
jgi:putative transposase